jgi:hypothetical protein
MNSHSVTFSRDNLIQLVLRPDFYEKNPGLQILQSELQACVAAFRESGRKAGCGCRADVKLLFGCMDNLLSIVESWKDNGDKEQLNNFIEYATKLKPNAGDKIVLTIYFRRDKTPGDVEKHEFTYQ